MRVYELKADYNHYQSLTTVNDIDDEILIDIFDGRLIGSSWKPMEVEVFDYEAGIEKPVSDFPSFGGVPVFSQSAVGVLRDLLLPNGEILPLVFENKNDVYFAYNTTNLIDVLNEELSTIKRLSDESIAWIDKFVFFPDRLKEAIIFKIPPLASTLVFVTDTFVDAVNQAKLTGFNFVPLWNDNKEN